MAGPLRANTRVQRRAGLSRTDQGDNTIGRIVLLALKVFFAAVVAYSMLWGALALWYRLPLQPAGKYGAIAVFLIPGAFALIHVFIRRGRQSLIVYGLFLAAVMLWWQTLDPPATGDWQPAVARQVTGQIEGDLLTLDNVRAFQWRSDDDVSEIWETRSYDLSQLQTLDLFLSYWGDPKMAHFMLSFGFSDGEYLTWSVEVRRERGSVYSPVADFFKEHTLVIVAAEEYDVVGLRSNIWENDVHLFRLADHKGAKRALLEGYVADANALARQPRWYNSIFTNCTTVVFKTMKALGLDIPFDWRMVVNGYLPEYLYDMGALNMDYSVDELRRLGRIAENARTTGLVPGYSEAVRAGVPGP